MGTVRTNGGIRTTESVGNSTVGEQMVQHESKMTSKQRSVATVGMAVIGVAAVMSFGAAVSAGHPSAVGQPPCTDPYYCQPESTTTLAEYTTTTQVGSGGGGSTTTLAEYTTTTQAGSGGGSTTTTQAGSGGGSTTTTQAGSGGGSTTAVPTTTVAGEETTSTVQSGSGGATTTVQSGAGGATTTVAPQLPQTGSGTDLALAAFGLLTLGLVVSLATRRPLGR
jgi:LPXTG-motif cell wall-anchored protein